MFHHPAADTSHADAFRYPRLWIPRGTDPGRGFLVDATNAVELDQLADVPVLGLLGVSGMGKSAAIENEVRRLQSAFQETASLVLVVDLAACGTDALVRQKIFEAREFQLWRKSKARLHLFLENVEICLLYVPALVALLVESFGRESRDRLHVRVACRTSAWPPDLESGLLKLWPGRHAMGVFELAPLRRDDVFRYADAGGVRAEEFLGEVDRLGASSFASHPITLRFLLDSFRAGNILPSSKTDLFRAGCLVLCDEWRDDIRRSRLSIGLSSGLRFALAGRLAAIMVFSRRAAICTAPRRMPVLDGDIRIDDLLGGEERFGRETVTNIGEGAIQETLATGLFRSAGPRRIVFSHRPFAEFLAAQYLVDHGLPVLKILELLFHQDGCGKVIPQLRETAAWLAAMLPEVCDAVLARDPETLFHSDSLPSSAADRRRLVNGVLRAYDNGELVDVSTVTRAAKTNGAACLNYPDIALDLKSYIVDKEKRVTVRLAAIVIAELTGVVEREHDLLTLALDEDENLEVRVRAAVAVGRFGGQTSRVALRQFATSPSLEDINDELKGAALSAAWPEYLSADELFRALTRPRAASFHGEYQRFLFGDFAVHISAVDMTRALQWARHQLLHSQAEHESLGRTAMQVVTTAVKCWRDPQVRKMIADILLQIARLSIPAMPLMQRVCSDVEARMAVSRAAIDVCGDPWIFGPLIEYGLVQAIDIPFFLGELEAASPGEKRKNVASLVGSILGAAGWRDTALVDQVLAAAERDQVLSDALGPAAHSDGAEPNNALDLRQQYEMSMSGADPECIFPEVCRWLDATFTVSRQEILPGWNRLGFKAQAEIVRAAGIYLNGYYDPDTTWIETGEIRYLVTCGYRALRLLAQ